MNDLADTADRILVLTPTGDDAAHAILVLERAGLSGAICEDGLELEQQYAKGAGALLIAEEALTSGLIDGLFQTLAAQPPWSDVPLLLITSAAETDAAGQTLLNMFAPNANITLIERPLRPISLVSALRAALRARRRQYQLRGVLEEKEKALADTSEQERRFRALVTASSNVVYRMNADWTEMQQLDGKGFVADTRGPSVNWAENYLPPEDRPAVLMAIGEAIRSKSTFQLEHRVVRVDGTLGWTFSRAVPLFDAQGKLVEWFGAASDVTERKRVEEELRRSAELLTVLIDHSPSGFYIVDADFCISHLNAESKTRAFQNVEPAIGRRLDEVMRVIWPEPLATEIIGIFRHTLDTGEPYRSPGLVGRRRDLNTMETYEWQVERITMPDGRHAVVCYYFDTTALREAERQVRESQERFDIVRDGAQVGFWFCDLPFDELIWDNRVKEHFWLAPDARVTIQTFYERIHPEDRERTRAAIAASIANRTHYDIEYRTVAEADGREHWIRAIGRTFYEADGQPIRFDGVTLDVTERKRAEVALNAAKETAEAASRAKDHFLAQLSHELRTPLTPVLMTATALRDDDALPDAVREQLAMVARNVSLEARLIDDLLDLTRITRGKLDLRAEPCDLHSLLGNVVEIVREEAREKQIDLVLDLKAQRHQLTGDPARLQQVFWNLLRNAVKFTNDGGQIRLRSHNSAPLEGSGGEADFCVEVSDNGIGFDPAAAKRLFRPFEQEGDHHFGGLGLGLAIAHAIVDLHGGSIRAESAGSGRGATFTVELPGAVAVETQRPRVDRESSPPTAGEDSMRLLLIEDHAATCEVLSRLLRKAGHDVTTAGSVAEARAAAGRADFDAVISDLGLPDGTGIELMIHLRDTHGLGGIALSGYGMDEDLRRSREAGFSVHLVKPVDIDELKRALRRVKAIADAAQSPPA